jgi:hypothetical protein
VLELARVADILPHVCSRECREINFLQVSVLSGSPDVKFISAPTTLNIRSVVQEQPTNLVVVVSDKFGNVITDRVLMLQSLVTLFINNQPSTFGLKLCHPSLWFFNFARVTFLT